MFNYAYLLVATFNSVSVQVCRQTNPLAPFPKWEGGKIQSLFPKKERDGSEVKTVPHWVENRYSVYFYI